jgi:hypothetical protein
MSNVVTQSAGLLARSLSEFGRTPGASGKLRSLPSTTQPKASGRRLLFSSTDSGGDQLSRQEANRGFILSCAAMKCGLASRKILTNAAPVLPIRIDRHLLDSAANTPPLRRADCFAVVEAQD